VSYVHVVAVKPRIFCLAPIASPSVDSRVRKHATKNFYCIRFDSISSLVPFGTKTQTGAYCDVVGVQWRVSPVDRFKVNLFTSWWSEYLRGITGTSSRSKYCEKDKDNDTQKVIVNSIVDQIVSVLYDVRRSCDPTMNGPHVVQHDEINQQHCHFWKRRRSLHSIEQGPT